MKKRLIGVFIGLVLLVSFSFVLARMTFIDEDDGVYNMYNNDIVLEKGWNLIHFSKELRDGSEISREDIKAVFYYNPSSKKYIRYYPESEEFNELINQNSCGDGSCNLEERTDYSSWCSQDCYYNFNEEIVSHLNVISEKNILLTKGEKATINFVNNADMEVYFDDDYNGNNLDLYHNTVGGGGGSTGICYDSDEEVNLLRTYAYDESRIYVKVDCSSDKKSFTFYEIDDPKVNPDESITPSFGAKIISQPAWVYSEKRGLLKTQAVSIKMEQNPLQSGWNFITITPEFDGKTWTQISQPCNVLKSYIFDAENQDWVDLNTLYSAGTFGEAAEQGQGIIMKVSGSCTLNIEGSSGGTPPTLP